LQIINLNFERSQQEVKELKKKIEIQSKRISDSEYRSISPVTKVIYKNYQSTSPNKEFISEPKIIQRRISPTKKIERNVTPPRIISSTYVSESPSVHNSHNRPQRRVIRIGDSRISESRSNVQENSKGSFKLLNDRFSEIISQKADQLKDFRAEKNSFFKDIQDQNKDLYHKYMSLTQQNNNNVMFIKKLTQELNQERKIKK
jgi:hypothetical protein